MRKNERTLNNVRMECFKKFGYQWQAQDMLVGMGCCYIPSMSHLGPPCCVFKSAPYIQNVYFLFPQMRLYHNVHRPWHSLHTRPSFHPEKWFIPFLSKPPRGCTLWNRCPSWGQPPGVGRKLCKTLHRVAFPAPPPFVFPHTTPACCCLVPPLQLGTATQHSSGNI